jgi:hypothetical protein
VTTVRRVLATLAIVATPRLALACPVCFGDANAPMTIATNNGIWFMLGIVAVMLSAFASFFIYLMRRARRLEDSSGPADAGPYVRGQEGTAQC